MTAPWTLVLAILSACWRGPVTTAPLSNRVPAPAKHHDPCKQLRRYLAMIPQDRGHTCDPFDVVNDYWWCRWDASNDLVSEWKWWAWAATNDLEACAGGDH